MTLSTRIEEVLKETRYGLDNKTTAQVITKLFEEEKEKLAVMVEAMVDTPAKCDCTVDVICPDRERASAYKHAASFIRSNTEI